MFIPSEIKISAIILHKVGNKASEDGIFFSKQPIRTDEKLNELLINYFFSPFKSEEYFNFYHESDLNLNEVYHYATQIFDQNNLAVMYEQSVNLAKHLYEKSIHHKIKGGDFFTVFFKDCILHGEPVNAVGLFKSENKDDFLKISSNGENFELISEKGIDIKKLDKGCLIFNVEREKGFTVAVVDNTNRNLEAQYWFDDFLHVRQEENEFYHTQNALSMCKNFVTKELPEQFEVSKADQIDLLNKSVQFFKQNENFNMEEFTQEVMVQPEVIESFSRFKSNFEEEHAVEIADTFAISETAVKKQATGFKSVIKLDKNFHIYVHGNRNMMEQGEDEKGKFYKLYYQKEE